MSSQYIVDKDFRLKKEKASVWTVIGRILMFFVATASLAVIYYVLFAMVFSTEEEVGKLVYNVKTLKYLPNS